MAKKKIIFYIYGTNWHEGGTMVMHLLSKILADMGEDVYMTITPNKFPDNQTKVISVDEATALLQTDDAVIVYPEVVEGNPLNAKNVVRWLLYYPGGHNVGKKEFDSSELVLPYFRRYVEGTQYENNPLLTIVQTRLNQFYPLNKQREFDCILIKKGRFKNIDEMKQKYLDPYQNLLDKPIMHLDQQLYQIDNVDQLNYLFNQVRYFISFDQATYYSIMASLAGCKSIVIPIDGLTKEQWIEQMPTYKYGVAYGFNDVDWVDQSREQLKGLLQETEKENLFFAENFVRLINERFN